MTIEMIGKGNQWAEVQPAPFGKWTAIVGDGGWIVSLDEQFDSLEETVSYMESLGYRLKQKPFVVEW